jgi:hypothetical protein
MKLPFSTTDDVQKRIASEMAIAYRQMCDMSAWKDLERLLEKMLKESNSQVDEVAIKDLTVADVAQSRGIRYVVGKIRRHIEEALNGGVA